MVKSVSDFREQFAEDSADAARERFYFAFDNLGEKCESPIEQVYLGALYFFLRHTYSGHPDFLPPTFSYSPIEWPGAPAPHGGIFVYLQSRVGDYRVDFLIRVHYKGKDYWLVVECDGHDFHERTKEQAARDRSRDRQLIAKGITVIRFTGSEIWADPEACAASTNDVIFRVQGLEPPR